MDDRTQLIEQIQTHYGDLAWVNQNAEDIYWAMREMLKNRKLVADVVRNMLLIYPALLNRGDLRRWAKLVNRAHKKIVRQELRRKPIPEYTAQQAYTLTPVAVARAKPRKPRSERLNQREMFEIYLSLMMSQIYTQSQDLAQSTLKSALAFARRLNDQYYYNKLYQTLAYIHLANTQFDQALDQARLAYQYWHGHPDTIEEALTAFAVAMAYRGKKDWEHNLQWLNIAANLFAEIDYPCSHGIIALETANTDIYMKNFEAACQWAEIALQEFKRENMGYHYGLAYHTLGLAQAYNGQFDDSIDNLWRSINYWESVGNLLHQVHTEHSLAFAEARMGKKERALMRLSRNRDLCKRIPASATKTYHLQQVNHLEQAIRDEVDLLSLFVGDAV